MAENRSELLQQGKKEEALAGLNRQEKIYMMLYDRASEATTYASMLKQQLLHQNAVKFKKNFSNLI